MKKIIVSIFITHQLGVGILKAQTTYNIPPATGGALLTGIGTASNNDLNFLVGANQKMKINTSGLVGINLGTAAPTATLDVNGTMKVRSDFYSPSGIKGQLTTSSFGIYTNNNWLDGSLVELSADNDSYNGRYGDILIMAGIGNTTAPAKMGNLRFSVKTSAGIRDNMVIIGNSGNVGIGTTSPNFLLSLGSNLANTKLAVYESGTNVYGIGYQSNQMRFHVGSISGRFSFLDAPNGNEILTLNGNGSSVSTIREDWKVFQFRSFNKAATMLLTGYTNAAGTTTQSIHLVVGNSNDPTKPCNGCASNEAQPNDGVIRLIGNHTNTHLILQNSNGGSIKFAGIKANQERQMMEIMSDGRVIIGNYTKTDVNDFVPGTASATFPAATEYKLIVATGILTPKVKCALPSTTDWKDYVLAPDYKLKSLTEVESFIKTNQHLPNVPSANELVKSGIDLVKMDATLLEKIEELTLYVIELKKENEKILKDMEALK